MALAILVAKSYNSGRYVTYVDRVRYNFFVQNEMNGVLGHDSALVRLYWAGKHLG